LRGPTSKPRGRVGPAPYISTMNTACPALRDGWAILRNWRRNRLIATDLEFCQNRTTTKSSPSPPCLNGGEGRGEEALIGCVTPCAPSTALPVTSDSDPRLQFSAPLAENCPPSRAARRRADVKWTAPHFRPQPLPKITPYFLRRRPGVRLFPRWTRPCRRCIPKLLADFLHRRLPSLWSRVPLRRTNPQAVRQIGGPFF
jgi:hypothetical protein